MCSCLRDGTCACQLQVSQGGKSAAGGYNECSVVTRLKSFIVLKCNRKTVLPRINARTLGNGPGRQVKADVCVVVAAKTRELREFAA